jgi:serine phosphatase RsbU (regulator of sigma subunit)
VYNNLTPVFEEVTLPLNAGDCFYMYSDGVTDQFGGPHEHKFSSRALRELVSSVTTLPMDEQGHLITEAFNSWKGNEEQCDDVLLIGFRI